MVAIDIVLRRDLDDSRLEDVRAILRAHNLETNPVFWQELDVSPPVPLIVIGLAPDRNVAAGLIGETRGCWFKISIMAVRRDLRRTGVGSRMLKAAESEAISRGCDRAFLETMDYQGPLFYEACGYARQCELVDWDSHGHAKYVYTKNLSGAPARGSV